MIRLTPWPETPANPGNGICLAIPKRYYSPIRPRCNLKRDHQPPHFCRVSPQFQLTRGSIVECYEWEGEGDDVIEYRYSRLC